MTNTLQRLLLFFLGIPGFIAIALFLPQGRNAAVVLLAVLIILACTREMLGILGKERQGSAWSLIANALLPLATYAGCILPDYLPMEGGAFATGLEALVLAAGLLAVLLLAPLAYRGKEALSTVASSAALKLATLMYPGFLASFWILICAGFEEGRAALFTFTLMTFGNDSLAWLTGVTLGRKRGIVAASPNKSIAGFIGGIAGSIAAAFIARALFPDALGGQPGFFLLFGILTGASVITGDLFESALKRSAGVKDSGSFVPGRGGFLDSFDSLIFAAPVFVLVARVAGYF
jgi:phosphatidate cytidylyltransferase